MDGRHALLNINLNEVKVAEDCNLDEIARLTEGYSGADITNVCKYRPDPNNTANLYTVINWLMTYSCLLQ